MAPYFFIMDERKICSFFGHRDVTVSQELYNATLAEIENAILDGCRIFYFGGYGDFDELCYQIVTQLKTSRPELALWRVYCVSQERYLTKKVRYFNRENYDEITYLVPSFNGWYKSIYYRNCAMIDTSYYILFYAENRENSGAYKAYRYANTHYKSKRIVNIWDTLRCK